MFNDYIAYIYLIISLITLILMFLLGKKYFKHIESNHRINELTKVLLILLAFLFIDSTYLVYSYVQGFVNPFITTNKTFEIFTKIGVFLSIIPMAYFILSKKIEELRDQEVSFSNLKKLNHELEQKAREMEDSQNKQQHKLQELERFNDIAKSREAKMLDLIKKIEDLEQKLEKKKK
jgi:hypothetical protein